jgi:uncharacterized DUF497 family protein
MFARVLNKMREKIRSMDYIMTIHAEEEMNNDSLSIFDVENVILTGEIVERQKDQETGEWKYLISGETIDGDSLIVACKLSQIDKLVIITVYVEE